MQRTAVTVVLAAAFFLLLFGVIRWTRPDPEPDPTTPTVAEYFWGSTAIEGNTRDPLQVVIEIAEKVGRLTPITAWGVTVAYDEGVRLFPETGSDACPQDGLPIVRDSNGKIQVEFTAPPDCDTWQGQAVQFNILVDLPGIYVLSLLPKGTFINTTTQTHTHADGTLTLPYTNVVLTIEE